MLRKEWTSGCRTPAESIRLGVGLWTIQTRVDRAVQQGISTVGKVVELDKGGWSRQGSILPLISISLH